MNFVDWLWTPLTSLLRIANEFWRFTQQRPFVRIRETYTAKGPMIWTLENIHEERPKATYLEVRVVVPSSGNAIKLEQCDVRIVSHGDASMPVSYGGSAPLPTWITPGDYFERYCEQSTMLKSLRSMGVSEDDSVEVQAFAVDAEGNEYRSHPIRIALSQTR